MRRWAILGLGLVFLAAGSQPAAADTRQAQVAGQFYPAKAEELRALVAHLLEASGDAVLPGKPRILIAPHAGYPYSGSIAAAGFRQLKGKTYEGVVVVGFTHRLSFESSSADHAEVYETPLGRIPIDTRAVRFLEGQGGGVRHHAEAHEAGEHSLEVELPFLQVALGEFKLIPILMGGATLAHAQGLADALAALAKRGDYLFVFSTDLSHYHPYDDAKNIDLRTLGAILGETPQAVDRLFEGGVVEACGRGPIVASLLLAAKLGYPERFLLAAANSGDTTGDRSRVVGYGTVVMADRPPAAGNRLSSEAGAALVKAARLALDMQLNPAKYKDRLVPLGLEQHPQLAQSTGLFVTLRKHGQLRGCIGRIEGVGPLAQVLPTVALDSALRDPRFQPVTAQELDDLEVEVSVLTPPVQVDDSQAIVPGRDGVILEHDGRGGVFLPQVWEETGWTRVEFLRELASQKAGLPPDAWRSAALYTFQDQVFSE